MPDTSTRTVHDFPVPASFRSSTLVFSLNSTKIVLDNPDPEVTLLEFIRAQGFTGTKLGCNEGGCGACTVVIGELEPTSLSPSSSSSSALRPRYRSVNACLMPLIAAHGTHILTIEGLGTSSKPHALQERFGKAGWFQCSACASGIIMAFYAQLRGALEDPLDLGFETEWTGDGKKVKGRRGLTEKQVEEGFDGNLCRCTGYRCLLDVAKTFAVDHKGGNPNILIEEENEDKTEGVEKQINGRTNGTPNGDLNGQTNGHTNGAMNGQPNGHIDPDVLARKPEDDIVPIKEATAIGGGRGTATGVLEKDRQPGAPVLCGKGMDCCKNKPGSGCNGDEDEKDGKKEVKTIPGIPVFTFKPYSPDAEPIFPPWLKKHQGFRGKDLVLVQKRREPVELADDVEQEDGEHHPESTQTPLGNVWLRPGSLSSLVDVMRRYPGAKIRSGNTETGIEVRFKASRFAVSVFVSDHIRDLATIRTGQEGLHIGSALPLSDLVKVCEALKTSRDFKDKRGKVMVLDSILDNLKHFASNQIRNVACLAGNITTASPISDLNPIWVATGATLKYVDAEDSPEAGAEQEEKSVNMRDFFLGYRKTALPRGAVVTNLFVPLPDESEDGTRKVLTRAYKQSKRKDDDIAIVTCCLRMEVEGKTIKDVRLVYGGMAPTTVESKDTQTWLTGKEVGDDAAFYGALERLSGVDFPLQYGVPGGMAIYRKSLAMGFFAKFWAEVTTELGVTLDSEMANLNELLDSEIHRGLCTGKQDLEDVVLAKKAGQSIPHLAHLKHVTGEAQYCDDIPRQHNELIGALVFSQKPHARILSINADVSLEMDGVHDFITVKDLPGSNIWNPPAMDEVLFAEDEVFTCGQVIGVVLAETKNQAQAAARAVKIEYEELPYILTIDEAIAADSFFKPRPKLERGDISKIDQADHVLEGMWRMGGQEQFYIETNATLAIPHPEDEMEVFSSTQNPSETQVFVASALGIPQNRVTTRVRRLGGGFGGKETRSICLAAQMAVAAYKTRRPVRCMLDRDEDMISSGQRHPFAAQYKVGFNNDGTLVGMDVHIYNNGGWSQDLSQAVLERAMTHSDNCYMIPNIRIQGKICKTNTMSNSAFRGFGGPQGMMLNECIMTRVAEKLDMPVETLREKNMYKEGDRTHFGQEILDWNVPTLWKQVRESSDFDNRKAAVEAFNAKNKWKKRGIAILPTKFGISFTAIFLNQAHALVNIFQHDGSVSLWHGGVEMGQGLHTKMAQVCATELGCPIEKIHIMETNTMTVVNTSATAASAGSDLNGMAIKDACEQLNARLAPYREKMPNATWQEMAHAAFFDRVNLQAHGHYQTPEIGYSWITGEGKPFFYFTQGAAVSEVEVDVLTGDHMIVRSDVHMDIGRSINPSIDVGQIEGAFTQGFGLTTMEESLWLNNGQLATRGPGAYKIPAALDTPREFNISFLKAKDAKTAHLRTIQSSKGVGEPPLFLGSSVFFAIKHALTSARADNGIKGDWTLDSPATCERIRTSTGDPLLAMAAKGSEKKEGDKSFFVSIF